MLQRRTATRRQLCKGARLCSLNFFIAKYSHGTRLLVTGRDHHNNNKSSHTKPAAAQAGINNEKQACRRLGTSTTTTKTTTAQLQQKQQNKNTGKLRILHNTSKHAKFFFNEI